MWAGQTKAVKTYWRGRRVGVMEEVENPHGMS